MADYRQFTRFNVVGCSGSGKSSLGRQISAALGLPYIEMDAVFWLPDWTEPHDDDFLPALTESLAGNAWVLDGNYHRTVPIKWQKVEVVVWLDLPYWQIFWQVLSRTLRRSITREELWAGNRESLAKAFFSRDSILVWSLTNMKKIRVRYSEVMQDESYSGIRFVRLRSRREVSEFVASLSASPVKQFNR